MIRYFLCVVCLLCSANLSSAQEVAVSVLSQPVYATVQVGHMVFQPLQRQRRLKAFRPDCAVAAVLAYRQCAAVNQARRWGR